MQPSENPTSITLDGSFLEREGGGREGGREREREKSKRERERDRVRDFRENSLISPGLQCNRNHYNSCSYRSKRINMKTTQRNILLFAMIYYPPPWSVGVANYFQQSFVAGLVDSR